MRLEVNKMLLATAGKIAVQLAMENDQPVWKAFLKNDFALLKRMILCHW